MKFVKNVSLLFLFLVLVSSCISTKVQVNTPYTNGIPVDSLNLVSLMVGPVWQPIFPLIDAAAFNEKTNKIADQLLDEEQKVVEDYKKILVGCLDGKLRSSVVVGSDFTSPMASQYRVEKGIQIDNKNFPVVFFSEGDMNMIDLGKGKNINQIFKYDKSLKSNIAKYAANLKLNNVVISFNRLAVISAGMFGTTGNLRLESYLFLYNAEGKLLLDTYGWMKPTAISGKDLADYKYQLDSFQELAELMSQELTQYIK